MEMTVVGKNMAKEEPETFTVQLTAFELGILVGGLSQLKLSVSPRIWAATKQSNKKKVK